MGVVVSIILIVTGFIGAALSQQMADEFKAWTPWLTERIIRGAIQRLPADLQQRYGEEWRSHIHEIPGNLSRLFMAISLLFGAWKITRLSKNSEIQKVTAKDFVKIAIETDDGDDLTLERIAQQIRDAVAVYTSKELGFTDPTQIEVSSITIEGNHRKIEVVFPATQDFSLDDIVQ